MVFFLYVDAKNVIGPYFVYKQMRDQQQKCVDDDYFIYLNKKKSCAHNTKNTKETKNTALRLRFAFALQVSVARRYITLRINNVKNYNLLMKTRVVNKRTNLGNMYLENTNINSAIIANANVT